MTPREQAEKLLTDLFFTTTGRIVPAEKVSQLVGCIIEAATPVIVVDPGKVANMDTIKKEPKK